MDSTERRHISHGCFGQQGRFCKSRPFSRVSRTLEMNDISMRCIAEPFPRELRHIADGVAFSLFDDGAGALPPLRYFREEEHADTGDA